MNSFIFSLNIVMPFFIYISFGYLIRAVHIADEAFMKRLNQMVFKAFFPLMMFYNMYNKKPGLTLGRNLVLFSVASLFLLVLLLFFTVQRFVSDRAKCGVVIQGIYRSNFVLFAIPLTGNVFGEEGIAVASMMVAIIVPLYNVIAIVILEYFRGGKVKPLELFKRILTNPLISGTLVGFLFVIFHITLPSCIEKPISQFSAMSTPLALFILGGTLKFSSMKKHIRYIAVVLGLKLLLIPGIILAVITPMGFDPISRFVIFTMFGTPIAASSYPMAASMGGDGDLAGELVVTSTVVSVFTIFLWVCFMQSTGML